ncbi:hypothetical protein ACFVU3_04610 [Streptomyces sp. NPDC058052]|uniref:hypothetical protein n=1 Tax=Streptomyces sp. NPDC058052 TaxID=3346316 RepID=UPI0036EB07E7
MLYGTGARVRLTRDVQVTGDDMAARPGVAGPLFLVEGLTGVVMKAAEGLGGALGAGLAEFEQRIRDGQFQGPAADMVEGLREQLVRQGAYGAAMGTRVRYKVRFDNGFVLDGIEEGWLTEA